MTDTTTNITPPTEQDARDILQEALGKKAIHIYRFPTDIANYVYGADTEDGDNLVIRLARPDVKHFFDGALFWYKRLEEKSVPVPKLYYSDVNGQHGFPIMIMDRLLGDDLGLVYPQLTSDQKKRLASRIVEIQRAITTLPNGRGFGYARSYDDPSLYENWIDVLNANLERSRERIREAAVIDEEVVDKAKSLMLQHKDYFSTVKPVCFLADITTKNVVVENGRLSGVVDFDSVAFGDPLLTVALTRMSLLASGYDTEYTDYWEDELNLSNEQRSALDSYTIMFCVQFLSEISGTLNKETTQRVDLDAVQRLKNIYDKLIAKHR